MGSEMCIRDRVGSTLPRGSRDDQSEELDSDDVEAEESVLEALDDEESPEVSPPAVDFVAALEPWSFL